MPIYEYYCNKCNKKVEVLVNSGEKAECPECKGNNLKKLFSVFSASSSRKQTPQSSCCACPSNKSCKHSH